MRKAYIYGCGTCGRDLYLKADLSVGSKIPEEKPSFLPESAAEPCERCRAVMASGDTDAFPEMTTQKASSAGLSGHGDLITGCLNYLMGWCQCGNPEDVTAAIMQYLEIIASDERFDFENNDESRRILWYFLAYIADYLDWTDHGGSVGRAWLTDTGREALRRYSAKNSAPGEMEAIEELSRIAEEYGLYDIPPEACITHKRFIPCRKQDGCVFSSDPEDIRMVREYQSG